MGKKKHEDSVDDKLGDLVDEVIEDAGNDRDRLVGFIEKLLAEHGDQPAGIAEYIAKLMDASTRQLQVKVAMLKALNKRAPTAEEQNQTDLDEIHRQVGLPFEDDADSDQN